ncbi:hypothetical protein MTR67_038928 [Solanum verrucosum]|uniref:Uncharacterized protein n=1 Tax=Solanum verrucosum TaxID=315347 RepID=A0AAF0ZPY2_SOLVR|nr:hypothetical protein MTR67_038928 [Solanum verrucosum]
MRTFLMKRSRLRFWTGK